MLFFSGDEDVAVGCVSAGSAVAVTQKDCEGKSRMWGCCERSFYFHDLCATAYFFGPGRDSLTLPFRRKDKTWKEKDRKGSPVAIWIISFCSINYFRKLFFLRVRGGAGRLRGVGRLNFLFGFMFFFFWACIFFYDSSFEFATARSEKRGVPVTLLVQFVVLLRCLYFSPFFSDQTFSAILFLRGREGGSGIFDHAILTCTIIYLLYIYIYIYPCTLPKATVVAALLLSGNHCFSFFLFFVPVSFSRTASALHCVAFLSLVRSMRATSAARSDGRLVTDCRS